MKWLKRIEQWIGGGEASGPRVTTFRLLIIVGLVGIAFMLFNSFVNIKKIDTGSVGREPPASSVHATTEASGQVDGDDPFTSIESEMGSKTRDMLEKIVGVGSVDVMVTVDSTDETVYQRNMKDSQQSTDESDASGGKRHTSEFTRDGEIVIYDTSGDKQPIITKKIKPSVRGVLVVAKGAENKVVKQMIIDAVEKGLNVPAYRIAVAPRKQAE